MIPFNQLAAKATAWSAADLLLRQIVQFGISIALARLLAPDDFGTIALLYLFVGLAGVLTEAGLTTALIRSQSATLADESTVFWANVGLGVTMAGILWAAAPAIADLYGKPVLEPLAVLMGVNVAFSSAGGIQQALFVKALNFRPLAFAGVLATVCSGTLAIWMAWAGYGVWALAMQSLTAGVVTTLLLWVLSPWRPAFVFSLDSARRLFGFGAYMMASGALGISYLRLYSLLVGWLYGVRELGFYSRAEATAQLPGTLLNGVLARVAFPLFSRMSTDTVWLKSNMRLGLQVVTLISAPAMLGLGAVAEPLVQVLFGPKWLPSVPFLRVLALAALLLPLHALNLQTLMAMGRSDLFFRVQVVKNGLGILVLFVAASFGAIGVAWGMVIAGVISYFVNVFYVRRLLSYGALEQLKDVAPALALAALMAVGVTALDHFLTSWPAIVRLMFDVTAGAAGFLAIALGLRVAGLQLVWKLIRNGLKPQET